MIFLTHHSQFSYSSHINIKILGSFSRTAVNSSSGVKTAFGGVYTGLLVIICLAFLMPYCAFIPKATLAAVIMTAVIFSVEYHVVKPMWSSKSKSNIFYSYISNSRISCIFLTFFLLLENKRLQENQFQSFPPPYCMALV